MTVPKYSSEDIAKTGYTFTDIKFEIAGTNMGPAVIDLRDTPTGKISLFTAYVAYQGPNDLDLKRHPNADLAIEMEQLHALASRDNCIHRVM